MAMMRMPRVYTRCGSPNLDNPKHSGETYTAFMSAFAQWLAETSGSIALHESLYMYPLVESIHVLTLCVFVGLAAVLDLRLMGITLKRVPVSEVARRLLPWMIGGLIGMTITGSRLFYAIPA